MHTCRNCACSDDEDDEEDEDDEYDEEDEYDEDDEEDADDESETELYICRKCEYCGQLVTLNMLDGFGCCDKCREERDTCHLCGRPTVNICSYCKKTTCREHLDKWRCCDECREKRNPCHICDKPTKYVCSECEEPTCNNCLEQCTTCHKWFCENDITEDLCGSCEAAWALDGWGRYNYQS